MIVVGDFNSRAVTDRYQRLIGSGDASSRLVNAYDRAYSPNRDEMSHPNELIDHILTGGPCHTVTSNWQVDKRTLNTGETLSDHDPVIARLHFTSLKQ